MLILPIVNRRRVMNVAIRLKSAEKVKKGVCYNDAKESDIIVNSEKFSDSSFSESREVTAPVDFIRSRSILYPRNFLVTTKEETNSSLYDVYKVGQPPKKVNESLDKLYSKAITDLRKEIPNSKARGRYVSFKKLGIDNHLTDDKIAKLQKIVRDERNQEKWPKLFHEAGIMDLSQTLDFINIFECTVISDTTIPENSLQDTLKSLSNINTRDFKNLNNYYQMAKTNTEIYTKISYINKIINDQPLTLIKANSEDAKKLVKKKEENDYKQAA